MTATPRRSIGGALTAIMTGVSYATSAEMAAQLGPFPGYKKNRDHMLRVMRNHRRAAYGEKTGYEKVSQPPVPLDHRVLVDSAAYKGLADHAKRAWDRALKLGEEHGYRNAQATVIAPTGTIGLVMDCDTTGIEPDFAHGEVQEAGRRRLLQDHQPRGARRAARARLLREPTSPRSRSMRSATARSARRPAINHTTLKAKGFTDEVIAKIEKSLPTAFDIKFAFNKWTLGEDFLQDHARRSGRDAGARRASTCSRTWASPSARSRRPTSTSAAP